MTKTIDTLVEDIYEVIEQRGGWAEVHSQALANKLSGTIQRRLGESTDQDRRGTLRLSAMGTPCQRKLWYGVNSSDEGEALSPSTKFKFLYGDILEDLLIELARAAGHRVEGEQDRLEVKGIVGHRDCVIDGITVDVKSASTYGFAKFKQGSLRTDDPFGYISQLSSYVFAGREHSVPSHPTTGAFLVVDKQHGHICLDKYDFSYELDTIEERFDRTKEMAANPEPPERGFEDVPEGKSGNRKLPASCSYCQFKEKCWPEARKFIYSSGPVFLTHVEKEPRVPEAT